MTKNCLISCWLCPSRWFFTFGIPAPPGPSLPAPGRFHVARVTKPSCEELLGGGRVRLAGGGHGPRAADVQTQDRTKLGAESSGEQRHKAVSYSWRHRSKVVCLCVCPPQYILELCRSDHPVKPELILSYLDKMTSPNPVQVVALFNCFKPR